MSGKVIPWAMIWNAAGRAVTFLPPPFNVIAEVAMQLARGYIDAGCTIDGCPEDIKRRLQPADIPAAGDAMRKAQAKAYAKGAGVDRASVDEAFARPLRTAVDDGDTDDGTRNA
jgi:hypothetical protein